MKADRSIFDATWQEVRDNIMPSGGAFIGKDPAGVKSNQYLLDETPEQAHQLEAAALHGMLMNPALKWVDLVTADPKLMENDEAVGWLSKARDILLAAIYSPKANATAAHHETFLEVTG